jgi:uncharacterized protein YbjQ (UPF0145 family)
MWTHLLGMATKLGFGVALLLFVSAWLLSGCAHEPAAGQRFSGPAVQITVHPWKNAGKVPDNVKLVSKQPDPSRYIFLGRVNGVTQKTELVDAAEAAQRDLKEKAAALGADVVKIDVLRPPNESARYKGVLLAGRAYKLVSE